MSTLKHPFVTEKAMVLLENESKLQFLVDRQATKQDIKNVHTLMSMHGEKKAVVSFENNKAAEEILSRLGIM